MPNPYVQVDRCSGVWGFELNPC